MAKDTVITLSDLTPDNRNYNKGNEFGDSLIEKSLRENGAGRSILLDKNNRIIAGNKTTEKAVSIGISKVRIIETNGNEIIAVKRTDIDLDTPAGRTMALADNATSKANITWDFENINQDFSEQESKDWGVIDNESDLNGENPYTSKIEAPNYEPKNEKPFTEDLVDSEKTKSLILEIQKSDILTKDEKTFLTLAAYRHLVFDYSKIADFYAHSTKQVQEFMERSALVIIDFNSAIENGYVLLSEQIKEQYIDENVE